MEFAYSHKLDLTDAEAAALHILLNAALKRRVSAGVFSSIETCEDAETIGSIHLLRLYAQKADVAGCTVFRDRVHD